MNRIAVSISLAFVCMSSAQADDFYRLNEALPANVTISGNYPLFDFDGDGCLPSAGVSRTGQQNGGLKPSGSITGGCRSSSFLETANTLHRHACVRSGADVYCAHFYALYFLKDQATAVGGGHRHDWEHAVIWTKNKVVTHGGYSKHGSLYNEEIGKLALQSGHLKIVYHKDGVSTHCMRFASASEPPENPYGQFVAPTIVSWTTLSGDGVSNEQMRAKLNTFDYGSASIPMRDDKFLDNINNFKPTSYPTFTSASFDAGDY